MPINSVLKLLFRLKCRKKNCLPPFCAVSVQGAFFVFLLNTLFLKIQTANDVKHLIITFKYGFKGFNRQI